MTVLASLDAASQAAIVLTVLVIFVGILCLIGLRDDRRQQ